MLRKALLFSIALSVGPSLVVNSAARPSATNLTAAQIVEKNVSAKGGLQAWRAVQTITFTGKMEAGGKQNVQLPFVLEKKRPRKTRVELVFANDTAVQVYDGASGWKLRPYLGRRDVEPYSSEELKSAAFESELDGPLVDYATKGNTVEMESIEKVDGHDAYKLKIIMKSGLVQHIWVDAETFLEVEQEGTPRRMDGSMRPVSIYLRDYKAVNGLMIPYVIETAVQGNRNTHKMFIESVVINPKLEDSLFAKPSP
jgi:outer membrane lipoprotein-sorting protein